jgi:hypothetical protein
MWFGYSLLLNPRNLCICLVSDLEMIWDSTGYSLITAKKSLQGRLNLYLQRRRRVVQPLPLLAVKIENL